MTLSSRTLGAPGRSLPPHHAPHRGRRHAPVHLAVDGPQAVVDPPAPPRQAVVVVVVGDVPGQLPGAPARPSSSSSSRCKCVVPLRPGRFPPVRRPPPGRRPGGPGAAGPRRGRGGGAAGRRLSKIEGIMVTQEVKVTHEDRIASVHGFWFFIIIIYPRYGTHVTGRRKYVLLFVLSCSLLRYSLYIREGTYSRLLGLRNQEEIYSTGHNARLELGVRALGYIHDMHCSKLAMW